MGVCGTWGVWCMGGVVDGCVCGAWAPAGMTSAWYCPVPSKAQCPDMPGRDAQIPVPTGICCPLMPEGAL